MYQNIPVQIKPLDTSAMITFSNAFNLDFSLLLREIRSPNLTTMQESTIEIESNVLVAQRLKGESKIRKKKKEEKLPSTSNQQSLEDKIDEMRKMIKRLTSKLEKLDIDWKNVTITIEDVRNRNQNQYRRPFNP